MQSARFLMQWLTSPPGVMLREAAAATTDGLSDTTTDEFPGVSLPEAKGSSMYVPPQGSPLPEKGPDVFLSIGSVTA